jgi:hypothetical protein
LSLRGSCAAAPTLVRICFSRLPIRPHVRVASAANLTGKPRLKIGQADIIGPSIAASPMARDSPRKRSAGHGRHRPASRRGANCLLPQDGDYEQPNGHRAQSDCKNYESQIIAVHAPKYRRIRNCDMPTRLQEHCIVNRCHDSATWMQLASCVPICPRSSEELGGSGRAR